MFKHLKSFIIWLLLVAVLLGRVVRSYEDAAETSESQTENRGLSDQSDIVNLNLSWKGLISVPAISPGQLVHILDLSHNNLHNLYNESFHPYPNLTKLILSSNNITRIEGKTFSSLQVLTEVDLSYNSLTFIHPSMFILNINLQTLSLKGNPLDTFESGTTFLIATSLRSLDLSHCHLLQFNTDSLSALPELNVLDLRQNNLQQLLVKNVSALSTLQLSGNPWHCDCHFHALLMWVTTNPMLNSDITSENSVQCWMGDKLRDLVTKKDWDSICLEATGQKITQELTVTSSNKDDDDDDDDGDTFGNYYEYYGDYYEYDDDFEELDVNISLSAGDIPSLIEEDDTALNLTLNAKVGDNSNELSGKYEVTNSTIQFLSLDHFISEDDDIGSYVEFSSEYVGFEEFDTDNISLLSIEITSSDHLDSDSTIHMKLENDITKLPVSTAVFSSQSNDIVDDTASDNIKDDTLNDSLDYDFKCIFCDNYAAPVNENQNLKYNNDYEFADPFVDSENVNSKEIASNAADIVQFQNKYDDLNPEDTGDQSAFNFDNLGSVKVTNNELSSDTINFPSIIDEDYFDVDNPVDSVPEVLNSAANDQEHKTLMNEINDKPSNETNLKIHTVIRFLILAGIVSLVVLLLLVTFYFVANIYHIPAFPLQVNEYKKLKNTMSENELLQNV